MVIDINLRTLCLILLFNISLQLQCDKKQVTAQVGGEFILVCSYDTNRYLFNKKYWCRGNARDTCEVLVDSEGKTKSQSSHRSQVVDARRRGLFVKVTHLQFDDAGVYWLGIDKVYKDIMTSVKVDVTEVPVSKPRLWPLGSMVSRPTCWGQRVTVRCGSTLGTGITYTWYHKSTVLDDSSDLQLNCGTVKKDSSDYFCVARNAVSSQRSEALSVQVLKPADSDCIYVINIHDQPVYDCADRMTTTTLATTTTTTSSTCPSTMMIPTDTRSFSFPFNQTEKEQFSAYSWSWTRFSLWYTLLRWVSFASLLISLFVVLGCIKWRHRRAKRKRRVRFRYLAQ